MKLNRIGMNEIFTAICIVAACAAFVMPAVIQARGDSNQDRVNTCMSNLKQLDLGMLMYCQDFDLAYPSGANWYGTGSGWAQQIYPYMRTTAVYHCPSDTVSGDVSSYAINSNLVHLMGPVPSAPSGQRISALLDPAVTVSIFEVQNNRGGDLTGYSLSGHIPNGVPSDIHRTGVTRAPLDGSSPGGRGLGTYQGELWGMGAQAAPSSGPLEYATGPMIGTMPNSSYVMSTARHEGLSIIALCDGHVAACAPKVISAGKNNPEANNTGGDSIAASTGSVTGSGLTATFSIQ